MITIGKILKPRGLSGEVKVQILTNKPDAFLELKTALGLKVKKSSIQNGFAYMMFEGINTAETAERLRGREIQIPREVLKLDSDEVLADDLIGFTVVGIDGKRLGTVRGVETYGASDVFDCGHFMFPNEDSFVLETDITKRQIIVNEKMLEEEVIL